MKKNFLITPVEEGKNKVEITFLKDFKLKVDKEDKVFVKFLMMLLHAGGCSASYFGPLLGSNKQSFDDIKKQVETQGVTSLFTTSIKNQPTQKLSNVTTGKVITLIVKNPQDSYKQIADKFNKVSKIRIDFIMVENICKRFGLKTS